MRRRRGFARAVGLGVWCAVGLVGLAAQGRQGGPPRTLDDLKPPTGTAAISGAVIDAVTGRPVPGAIVALTGLPTTPTQGRPSASNPRGRVLTDDQGRFVATDLPGGFTYTVAVTKFGYFDGGYGRRGVSNAGTARRITLVDGQWFRDARIDLTPYGSISGIVVDEAGEPMVDVTVRAYAEIFVSGARHIATGPAITTDDRGRYRLAGLAPGRYIVSVPSAQHAVPLDVEIGWSSATPPAAGTPVTEIGLTEGLPALASVRGNRLVLNPNAPPLPAVASGQPQVYPTTFYPGTRLIKDATAIDLKPGEERVAVDLQMRPVPVVTISGVLQGPPEAVQGMPIRLLGAGAEGLGRGAETATTVASADGSFVFLNIPAGSYTIVASRTIGEYASRGASLFTTGGAAVFPGARTTTTSSSGVMSGPQGTSLSRQTYAGDNRYYGRRTVTVAGRELTGVSIPMQMGVSISGHFMFEGKNAPATPTLGGWITAEPANGDPTLSQFRSNRAGGPGPPAPRPQPTPGAPPPPPEEFLIEGVQPGEFLLRPLGGLIKSITWNGRDYTDTPFDTSAGRDITGVIVTTTDQGCGISGVVRDGAGQPIPDTVVIYFPTDRTKWSGYGPQPTRLRSITPTSEGRYQTSSLQAGEYFVIAVDDEHADRWKDPAFLESASRAATRVRLEWGDRKVIDLVRQEVK